MMENFKECIMLSDANKVDLELYRYTGFDPYRGYMFALRQKKVKK
jgi:hypothetical protein